MFAENQLQTRLIALLFLLSAVTMGFLASQNYRYGLYGLVYTASSLCIIFLGVSLFTRFTPETRHIKKVCFWSIIAALILMLFNSIEYAEQIKYWIFPIGLLSYISLSHRHATLINSVIVCLFSLILLFTSGSTSVLTFIASYCLFMGLASTYAQLHQKRNRTLVELEIHDTLTGAYNYRHLEDTLKKEICRSDRTGKALSLITLEIDYFPQVNNLHGTAKTQELIVRLAGTLKAMIRAGDSDYFDGKNLSYLLLPCTPSEGVLVIAERIRRTIEESNWPVVDSITVSLGCTTYVSSKKVSSKNNILDDSFESNATIMINHANNGLIEAQKNGHNRVCLQ